MMGIKYVLPEASRRVKLLFDENGDPAYPSVTSPECFNQRALGVLPPRDVIPIVFVPGIMGTNLNVGNKPAWAPPNTTIEGLCAVGKSIRLSPAQRQRLFDPDNTVVSKTGPCQVPDRVYKTGVPSDQAAARDAMSGQAPVPALPGNA